jgi:iron only hydrogenase large subunit-like protein
MDSPGHSTSPTLPEWTCWKTAQLLWPHLCPQAAATVLSTAVAEGLKEQHLDDFQLKACACDGIEECRMALLKKSKNALDANFIEGMACVNGCIGGAGNLTHGEKNKAAVDSYGREALEKTILDAIAPLQ